MARTLPEQQQVLRAVTSAVKHSTDDRRRIRSFRGHSHVGFERLDLRGVCGHLQRKSDTFLAGKKPVRPRVRGCED